jgi:hypothetical protein
MTRMIIADADRAGFALSFGLAAGAALYLWLAVRNGTHGLSAQRDISRAEYGMGGASNITRMRRFSPTPMGRHNPVLVAG